ncbi:MAG: hypothetical protein JNM63_18355, partial [Spirochaetia bacterium]|nr:hypothetical protein [Spirochaetia bacterium]
MKKLRLFAVWGVLLAAPVWSVEIYNFPDLAQTTASEETGDTNFKTKPRVYNLATNLDFYNLGSPSDLYPNLKDVLLEMRLREYYADQRHA